MAGGKQGLRGESGHWNRGRTTLHPCSPFPRNSVIHPVSDFCLCPPDSHLLSASQNSPSSFPPQGLCTSTGVQSPLVSPSYFYLPPPSCSPELTIQCCVCPTPAPTLGVRFRPPPLLSLSDASLSISASLSPSLHLLGVSPKVSPPFVLFSGSDTLSPSLSTFPCPFFKLHFSL